MYPFKNDYVLLKNCWYVGALSNEVSGKPLGRTILAEPVVFYRKENGAAVAAAGLCPHRFFPFSEGKVVGDNLVCRYHGLAFEPGGRCVHIPSQATVPEYRKLRTYPVIEKAGLIWIWTGVPEEAFPEALPDLDNAGLDGPEFWRHGATWHHVNGRYMALLENLTDLTHIGGLHAESLPGGDAWVKSAMKITEENGVVTVVRPWQSPWNGFLDYQFGADNALSGEMTMHSRSDIFSNAYIRTSGLILDNVDGLDEVPTDYGSMFFHHFITPETERTTHYFGFVSRNYRRVDSDFDAIWNHADNIVRGEDVFAVETMEPYLENHADTRRELITAADTVSVRFRRSLQRKLSEERERSQNEAAAGASHCHGAEAELQPR